MAPSDRRAKLRHTAAVGGFALACAIVLWQCFIDLAAQGAASGGPQYNAAFVPELLAGILLALCAVQLGRVWLGGAFRESEDDLIAEAADAGAAEGPDADAAEEYVQERWLALRAVICIVLLVAFIAVVPTLGYYLAMPLLLAGVFVTLDVRNVLAVVGLSIGLTLLAGYAFGGLLNVALPPGFLGFAPW
jgi:putative tricarboxylic transport membrane protein